MRNESVLVNIKVDSLSSIKSHLDGKCQAIVKGKIILLDVEDSSQYGCGLSSVVSCHCDRCALSDLDDAVSPTIWNVANNHHYQENFGWQNDMVENGSDGTEDDGNSECGMFCRIVSSCGS